MELLKSDSLKEAQIKLKNETEKLQLKTKLIKSEDACCFVCAQNIYANENVPPFRRSCVDGFAIRAQDSYGANESSPIFFDIVGQLNIDNYSNITLNSQQAVQIQTGSMIPFEANAVVMVEYCETYAKNKMAVYRPVSINENVIQEGEDIHINECLIQKGRRLTPSDIGMLASLGIEEIEVYQPLKIAVLSSGDELKGIHEKITGSYIRDINSYSLASRARQAGLIVKEIKKIRDDEKLIHDAVLEASADCDIVVISGGSSKGNKDYTKRILEEITHCVLTHGIAIKPGKPTIISYDHLRETLIVGLPGHPLAAMMMFELIVLNWVNQKMNCLKKYPVFAQISENVSSNQGRETCLFVHLIQKDQGYEAVPIYSKSGSISVLSKADGYTLISRQSEGLKKGETVQVEVLS